MVFFINHLRPPKGTTNQEDPSCHVKHPIAVLVLAVLVVVVVVVAAITYLTAVAWQLLAAELVEVLALAPLFHPHQAVTRCI